MEAEYVEVMQSVVFALGLRSDMKCNQRVLKVYLSYDHPSLPAGLPNYIPCPHRTDLNKFFLVGQHWCVYVSGSIEERHMRSSSLLKPCPTFLVHLYWDGFCDGR